MSEIVDSGNKESTFSHTVNRLSHYLKENGMGSRGSKENRMTIIYGGQMVVVDHFPADRAKEIMMLARRGGTTPAADWVRKHSTAHNELGVAAAAAAADLPLARKASLARFLEKRKERITARAAAAAAAASACT